ncbi:MAG: ATP-binding protein [Candidatus Micrarchaeota archaeon]
MITIKGPNPFAWNPESFQVSVKKINSSVFTSFLNANASKQPGILIITGELGVGKTIYLRNFRHEAEKAGVFCTYVKMEKGEDEIDLVDKMFQEEKNLDDAIDHLSSYSNEGIMFIDGVDRIKKTDQVARKLVNKVSSYWGKKKFSIVMSSVRPLKIPNDEAKTINLTAFNENDMQEMVRNTLKDKEIKMGRECLRSILNDSSGNPRVVLLICWHIYEKIRDNEKIITKSHYLNYLPYIMTMLSNEWFGEIYHETSKSERQILKILAKNIDGIHVSQIAKKLKKPLGPTSTLTMRLVNSGQVIRVERGEYKIFSALYGRYVLQRS